jgi:anti-sigma B factor antagonist
MSTAPPILNVDVAHVDEACVIRTQGELDIATAPALESALLHALDSLAPSIVLDLERVSFIDSMGLRVLVWAAKQSREDGDRLRIDCGSGVVHRMIELTNLDRSLPLTGLRQVTGLVRD